MFLVIKIFLTTIAILVGLGTMPAFAGKKHHHSSNHGHHHHHRHHRTHVEPQPSTSFNPFSFFQQSAQTVQAAHTGAGRPSGCPHAWCGCWLRHQKGISDSGLNLAANWRHWGSQASYGCVGCVAVMRHHVGQIQGYDDKGNILLLSGNHGHRVGIGTYSRTRIIAYRS